jgi:hypothetical protein
MNGEKEYTVHGNPKAPPKETNCEIISDSELSI